jgi:hypothetical protein
LNKTRHQFAKKFNSLKDIYKNRFNIATVETIEAQNNNNRDKLFKISDDLQECKPDYMHTFDLNDFISEYVGRLDGFKSNDRIKADLSSKGCY